MAGVSFPISAASARQWLFVGFWFGFGLVSGAVMAACTAQLALKVAGWLLGGQS